MNLADVVVELDFNIDNPFPVYDSKKRLLGSAVVSAVYGKLLVRFILDPHNPESFDLMNEPERCKVSVDATMVNGVLSGKVVLTSA